MGSRPSCRGCGKYAVFNHGVDPQLRIMERLGDMRAAALLENLRFSLAADDRDICLRFLSKGDCIRSCTRSHAPVQEHNRNSVIQYISVGREVMNPSRKRKLNDYVYWGSHRGNWDRSGLKGTRKSGL